MSLRRACKEGLAHLRRHGRTLEYSGEMQRYFSALPEDISQAASKAKFPPRRLAPQSSFASSAAEASTIQPAQAPLNMAKEGARIATSLMFPWERRQIEGTGDLRLWEKIYWGVFVVAISLFLFNRLRDWNTEEPEEDTSKEQRKEERARMVLAGDTVLVPWGDEDPFEGMTPQEVQEYVEKTTGANAADPFEGMDPAEIDAYVKQHGLPGAQ